MRPTIDYRTAGKDAYELFKNANPGADITFQQFRTVIHTFNSLLAEYILQSGERIKLPGGFGELTVAKYKPKKRRTFLDKTGTPKTIIGLPIDWQKSRQQGKLIFHLNAHTDGYRYRWKWFKKTALFESSRCFSFKPNRISSRRLAQLLKSDSKYAQIYREWPQG